MRLWHQPNLSVLPQISNPTWSSVKIAWPWTKHIRIFGDNSKLIKCLSSKKFAFSYLIWSIELNRETAASERNGTEKSALLHRMQYTENWVTTFRSSESVDRERRVRVYTCEWHGSSHFICPIKSNAHQSHNRIALEENQMIVWIRYKETKKNRVKNTSNFSGISFTCNARIHNNNEKLLIFDGHSCIAHSPVCTTKKFQRKRIKNAQEIPTKFLFASAHNLSGRNKNKEKSASFNGGHLNVCCPSLARCLFFSVFFCLSFFLFVCLFLENRQNREISRTNWKLCMRA